MQSRIIEGGHKDYLFGSIVMSMLISLQYINQVLVVALNSETGFVSYLFIALAVLLAYYFFRYGKTSFKLVDPKALLFPTIIVLGFFLTFFLCGSRMSISIRDFLLRCILPLLVGMFVCFDAEKTLRLNIIVLCIGIPFAGGYFVKGNAGAYDAITMGASYALLPMLASVVIHFFFFRKKGFDIIKIFYIASLVFIVSFFAMSYRGALVSFVIIFFASLIVSTPSRSAKRFFWIATVVILSLSLIIFRNALLMGLDNLFKQVGLKVAFVEKSIMLNSSDNFLHGRSEIYQACFNNLNLFGHGFSTFSSYTNYGFPHNFILQFLFDFGLFVGIPFSIFVTWILISKSYRCIRSNDNSSISFMILLVGSSVPRVMVSAETWLVILFWLCIGFLLRKRPLVKKLGSLS